MVEADIRIPALEGKTKANPKGRKIKIHQYSLFRIRISIFRTMCQKQRQEFKRIYAECLEIIQSV